LEHSVWAWTDRVSYQALHSGDLGAILRAYRRINGLSQEKLAAVLGYDNTYISMIETGRRDVHDVAARRHIARTLAIPSHLLGVTDPADTEFVAMIAFAESTVRLVLQPQGEIGGAALVVEVAGAGLVASSPA
jgi:transcriptional regulator with XRE-family HTH domain